MSLRPSALIETSMGMLVVIDDGSDFEQVLVIPASFDHRRVVGRSELEGLGQMHVAIPPEVVDALDFYAREANYDNGQASSEAGARAREAMRKLGVARIRVVRGPEFNTLHFECLCGARWMAPEDDVPPPDETECPNCVGLFKTKVEDGS